MGYRMVVFAAVCGESTCPAEPVAGRAREKSGGLVVLVVLIMVVNWWSPVVACCCLLGERALGWSSVATLGLPRGLYLPPGCTTLLISQWRFRLRLVVFAARSYMRDRAVPSSRDNGLVV